LEQVTLTVPQIPAHSHPLLASADIPTGSSPDNSVTGQAAAKFYRAGTAAAAMNASSITPVGGSQPHNNMQPYLCVNFIISLFGIFPSPT
jgi:microcystin-dependent protein